MGQFFTFRLFTERQLFSTEADQDLWSEECQNETFQMHRRTGALRSNCEADRRCALTLVEDGTTLPVMSLTDPGWSTS